MRTIDLSHEKLLRLTGHYNERIGNRGIKEFVKRYLAMSFTEVIDEFDQKLYKASEEIKNRLLYEFKEPIHFKTAWDLANMRRPLKCYDFLSYTNPEKIGILCGINRSKATSLSTDLNLFNLEGCNVLELNFSLYWWNNTVRHIWSVIILNYLISTTSRNGKKLLGGDFSSDRKFEAESISFGQPLEKLVEIKSVDTKEADSLHSLYYKAHLGSRFCEFEAGNSFKEWLKNINLGDLQKHGLTFQEAHLVLLAGSQVNPEIEIEMRWDQTIKFYRFVCFVKNLNTHGFKDEDRTVHIQESLLLAFFENSKPEIQASMVRLLISAGFNKARDLLFKSINHDAV